MAEYFLHGSVSVSAGIAILQKGARFPSEIADDSVSLVALQVPLMLTARSGGLRFGVGLAPEYLVYGSYAQTFRDALANSTIDQWHRVHRRNLALVVELAYEIPRIFGTKWTVVPGLAVQSQLYDHQIMPHRIDLAVYLRSRALNGVAVMTMYYELD